LKFVTLKSNLELEKNDLEYIPQFMLKAKTGVQYSKKFQTKTSFVVSKVVLLLELFTKLQGENNFIQRKIGTILILID